MGSRTYHVDDTDPRFTFHGNWTAQQTSDSWGLSGPPFNLTLHETTSDGVVVFRFKNVSNLSLYGHIDTINQPKPSWNCALDDKTGDWKEAPVNRMSHFPFCKFAVNDGGDHQLTFNVTMPPGAILAIDAIALTPAEGVTISEGEVVQIQHDDPAVTYRPVDSWEFSAPTDTQDTDTPGSSVQLNFRGSSVLFSATYIANKAENPGTYTIDGSPPKSFIIPGAVSTSYNNILFSEEGLTTADHSLNVTFTGKPGNAPLSLGYFFVTLPPGRSPLVSSAQTTGPPLSPSETPSARSSHAGATAGGIVGGVVGLAVIMAGIFLLWRRYRENKGARNTAGVSPFVENKPQGPTPPISPLVDIQPLAPNLSSVARGDGKPGPVVMSYEPQTTRLDVQHEDSGYRMGDPSISRVAGGVEIRDIPPVYSPV